MAQPIPNEIVDQILELLPVHVAVSLRRKAVLREHNLNGKLRLPIQRALNRLDVDALKFFTAVCLHWTTAGAKDGDMNSEDGWSEGTGSSYEEPQFSDFEEDDDEDDNGDFEEEDNGDEGFAMGGAWADDEDEDDAYDDYRHRKDPVAVAIIRNRWDAVRFFVDAGFSTRRAVDVAVVHAAELDDIRYLLALGHGGIASSAVMTNAALGA
ncbi:hypothetical protein BDK51DRAFT_46933 [Blyttiomyces helicus]|uniref:Uncharacterized protein n=1 Tax=Blyttiomyces helicus TaxID=388810 RepID=A0A4P9VYQ3_9FUNG|nr:hypothetical protein BDK51DRAFT_46933 [Blyttiomyces helicus]|eukprot:RKO84402.1 hypothetical protein BDK51DRAFT_46933 [Blyttiomyces helicus]